MSATIRTLHFVVLRRSSNTTSCTNFANSTGSNQSTIIVDAVTVAEFSTVTTRWINRAFTVRDSSAFVITDDGCLWVGDGLLNSFHTNWTILPSCFWVEIGRYLWLVVWRQLRCVCMVHLSDFVDWYFCILYYKCRLRLCDGMTVDVC